jgi:hypothetical protein
LRVCSNKNSDEWFCSQGNKTIRKRYVKRKDGRELYMYYFEKAKCKNCPNREGCIAEKTKAKVLGIGINTTEFYKYSQEQKEPEFKEKYKNRSCQEWKNGEMKNFHGLDRARGYGLRGMSTQAKLTAIAVNLKRIASILSSRMAAFFDFLGSDRIFTKNLVYMF